ncbi:MAG TPA: hypothetical protein VNK46_14280 [Nitrospiraceae bacterium]|nr:hypothetical protein [Nitrospiraceae bacterium]
MRRKTQYQMHLADEEAKLRWLITRQPGSVELRYYLLFLLVANRCHIQAAKECERILAHRPDDVIAGAWMATLARRLAFERVRHAIRRRRKSRGHRWWGHVCRYSE